jgi:copper homeostasis protein (lipoprotein)
MTSKTNVRPTTTLLCISVAFALALGACKRDEPAPTDTPQADATAAADPAPTATTEHVDPPRIEGTDAIAVSENTSADAGTQGTAQTVAGTELKDFAGSFAGSGTSVQLNADGTYAMTARAESAGADLQTQGTWTVQAAGKELLLDSDDKSEADRLYGVVSKDELKAGDGGQVLRRDGTP